MYGGRQSASRSGHFTLEKRAVDDDDDVDFWTAATNGRLFITQVIYEYGEPWWSDIERENSSFVHQSSLTILLAVI
jgi:hypothetical protein